MLKNRNNSFLLSGKFMDFSLGKCKVFILVKNVR